MLRIEWDSTGMSPEREKKKEYSSLRFTFACFVFLCVCACVCVCVIFFFHNLFFFNYKQLALSPSCVLLGIT